MYGADCGNGVKHERIFGKNGRGVKMNELQIFQNSEFGEIRTIEKDGEPWFVGKDVAEILGYANASKAVSTHVDDEDKTFIMLDIADSQNGNLLLDKVKPPSSTNPDYTAWCCPVNCRLQRNLSAG